MTEFNSFGLTESLIHTLTHMDFTKPTPVQEQTIPLALSGRDVLGSAQTGTGKTGAFSIPLIEHILRDDNACGLILTPTRELAKQVMDVIHQMLGRKTKIKTAFIIGGEPYHKQMSQLRNNPRIIVGTPGRVNDHLDRKSLKLDRTSFLILDETDRMLDMGFGVQLDRIVTHLPKTRQTLMFSATLPDGIIRLSKKYLNNPTRVSVGATNVVAPKINQEIITLKQEEKYSTLADQLETRKGSVIVFMKTKYSTERMAKSLNNDGFTADALHGDLRQSKRTRVLQNFRDKKFRILVATDIAARGLDVPHIEHVVNFDLPQLAEDYIHRMGRTARAGAEGSALVFISGQDKSKWREIEKLLGIVSEKPEGGRRKSRNNGDFDKKGRKPYRGGKPQQGNANGNAGNDNGHGTKKPFRKKFAAKTTEGGNNGKGGKPAFKKTQGRKNFSKNRAKAAA
jgi:superfamily II DNA/RNA helicase